MARKELDEAISFMEEARTLPEFVDRLWQAVDTASDDAGCLRAVLEAALASLDGRR